MKKHNIIFGMIVVLAAGLSLSLLPQSSGESKIAAPSFNEYQFIARGKISGKRGIRPEQIVQLDNNGEILLACIQPQTVDQLKAKGLVFSSSQLELLVDWSFLVFDRKEKTYRTTIHIYGPEKAAAIRDLVDDAVIRLARSLHTDLLALKSSLEKAQQEKSLFSILYGYVLHDYSMRQFGPELYEKPQLSVDNPFWNGFAWAIHPVKRFNVGVTTLPAEDSKIFFISSPAVTRPDFRQLLAFVKDASGDGKIEDPELQSAFSAYGVCRESGELTIPIFEGERAEALENMAEQVYAHTIELVETNGMKNLLGMKTQAQAAMFIHYEIRFAFLSLLLEKGLMAAPIDFENADNNPPSAGRFLVFIIK